MSGQAGNRMRKSGTQKEKSRKPVSRQAASSCHRARGRPPGQSPTSRPCTAGSGDRVLNILFFSPQNLIQELYYFAQLDLEILLFPPHILIQDFPT